MKNINWNVSKGRQTTKKALTGGINEKIRDREVVLELLDIKKTINEVKINKFKKNQIEINEKEEEISETIKKLNLIKQRKELLASNSSNLDIYECLDSLKNRKAQHTADIKFGSGKNMDIENEIPENNIKNDNLNNFNNNSQIKKD